MCTKAKIGRVKEAIAEYDRILHLISEKDAFAAILVRAYRKRATKRLETLCETGTTA